MPEADLLITEQALNRRITELRVERLDLGGGGFDASKQRHHIIPLGLCLERWIIDANLALLGSVGMRCSAAHQRQPEKSQDRGMEMLSHRPAGPGFRSDRSVGRFGAAGVKTGSPGSVAVVGRGVQAWDDGADGRW